MSATCVLRHAVVVRMGRSILTTMLLRGHRAPLSSASGSVEQGTGWLGVGRGVDRFSWTHRSFGNRGGWHGVVRPREHALTSRLASGTTPHDDTLTTRRP